MSKQLEYEQLVAARKELLAQLSTDLNLPRPDSLAHDQQLVIKRHKVRMRVYDITKRLNEIQHQVQAPALMVEVRSRGCKEWVPHSVELAAYLTSSTVESVKQAAASNETIMSGNFFVRYH